MPESTSLVQQAELIGSALNSMPYADAFLTNKFTMEQSMLTSTQQKLLAKAKLCVTEKASALSTGARASLQFEHSLQQENTELFRKAVWNAAVLLRELGYFVFIDFAGIYGAQLNISVIKPKRFQWLYYQWQIFTGSFSEFDDSEAD